MMYSPTQQFLIYTGLFFTALVFSLMINSVFMRFARNLGIREQNQAMERWSASAKPAFGGIGFFILFLVSFTLHGVLFPEMTFTTLRPDLLGLLAATSLGFIMGLADDAYNTNPLLKLLVQLGCGAILIASGTCIDVFETRWFNIALTLIWVVGMMNSINMLDNMDGITTVVSIGILIAGIIVQLVIGPLEPVYMVLMIGLMASLCGFLYFNWNPSRMFMGDTGSQLLGVFLAFVGIRFFWNAVSSEGEWEPARQLIAPLIAFLLPIVDTTIVSFNRMAKGTSPFVGGRDHTTHHLSYAGLSDAKVAFTFIGISMLNGFLILVMFKFIPVWENLYTGFFVLYALAVFIPFFILTKRTRPS
ncbi:MAG: MraY family glycosyltransferase [Flavobacteriales bacterium]|nr:undecaprenyl/decaprenyl-phosphate alpha-N-acetylglucosaminyl 1-phosphate transferase [Flavobacteriales bacterium]